MLQRTWYHRVRIEVRDFYPPTDAKHSDRRLTMSLATRARTAAAQAADYPLFAARFSDETSYAVRMRLATNLACLLGIDPVHVTIHDDPARRWGPYVWPLLQVTDPDDGHTYTFTCEPGHNTFLALGLCPACSGTVPVARIIHLADLGDLLARGVGTAEDGDHALHPPAEFDGDPGHDSSCPYRHQAE